MSKDQAVNEGSKKVNELLDQRVETVNRIAYIQFGMAKNGVKIEDMKDKIFVDEIKKIDSQIDAELNKTAEGVKSGQGNTAQVMTEKATETARAQEQSNDNSADKAEIANQQSRNKDLQSKIQEVQQQKATEEQNLNSAKENTKNVVSGLNPEQKEFVIQKLTEQGNTEAVNIINSQPAPQQEAQDPNMMGQTQEHIDQPQ